MGRVRVPWCWLTCAVIVAAAGHSVRADVTRGDEGLGCDPVGPCGGQLLGSWRLVKTCADMAPPSALCRAAPVDQSQLAFDGTLALEADGTFTIAVTPKGTWTTAVPDHCLVGLSCAAFGDAVSASGQSAPVDRASCDDGATGCQCSFRVRRQTQSARGTFTTGDGVLTLDRGRAEPGAAVDYCVSGDWLTIAAGRISIGGVTLTGDLVFRRR